MKQRGRFGQFLDLFSTDNVTTIIVFVALTRILERIELPAVKAVLLIVDVTLSENPGIASMLSMSSGTKR